MQFSCMFAQVKVEPNYIFIAASNVLGPCSPVSPSCFICYSFAYNHLSWKAFMDTHQDPCRIFPRANDERFAVIALFRYNGCCESWLRHYTYFPGHFLDELLSTFHCLHCHGVVMLHNVAKICRWTKTKGGRGREGEGFSRVMMVDFLNF